MVSLAFSDRLGLKDSAAVEKVQDAILGAYKRYIAEKRPAQPVHWAKVLMKVPECDLSAHDLSYQPA